MLNIVDTATKSSNGVPTNLVISGIDYEKDDCVVIYHFGGQPISSSLQFSNGESITQYSSVVVVTTGSFPFQVFYTARMYLKVGMSQSLSNGSISFSTGGYPCAAICFIVRPDTNAQVGVRNAFNLAYQGTSPSIGSSSSGITPVQGSIVIGSAAVYEQATSFTDTDTTNGSWSSLVSASNNDPNNLPRLIMSGQTKLITADGHQTYGGSIGSTSRETGLFFTELIEVNRPYWGLSAYAQ